MSILEVTIEIFFYNIEEKNDKMKMVGEKVVDRRKKTRFDLVSMTGTRTRETDKT